MQEKEPPSGPYAYYVVGVLMLAYMFAFIDRIILSLVIDPVRADLGLSETEISLLAGFAFAAFYTLLGLPFGRWADTRGRRNLIAIGIALWSVATVACGLANNFFKLFLARMAVGVGEATLTPSAYSLIPDYFTAHRRAFAMAVFSCGITIGGGLALLLGGFIVEWATANAPVLPLLGQLKPWQFAFVAVGAPGVLVALLVLLTVREPPRRLEAGASATAPKIGEVISYLFGHWRVFAPVIFGLTGMVVAGYAFNVWAPVYFMRVHAMSPGEVGVLFGLSFAVLGTLGVLFGGALSDRLSKAGRADAPVRVSLWAAWIQAPLFIGCYLSPSALWAQILFGAALFVASMYGGLQGAAVQSLTPNRMRGQVGAVYLTIANLVGLGLAPTMTALMTENVFGGPMGVGKSLATTVAISLTIAVILLTIALKPMRQRVEALQAA
ncbi:MAG: MFS transporter [Hyphomonadaceae bacterium]|nr:MFS transporter [Hyphomonadaceae bacterium]